PPNSVGDHWETSLPVNNSNRFFSLVRPAPPGTLLFDLDQIPVLLHTDSGAVTSAISGQIALQTFPTMQPDQFRLESLGALLYAESVSTAMGTSGPITLDFNRTRGQATLTPGGLFVSLALEGVVTFDLLDELFGVIHFPDYTESRSEP